MSSQPCIGYRDPNKEKVVMLRCPVPGCGAVRGEDYVIYADHLYTEHDAPDLGLDPWEVSDVE